MATVQANGITIAYETSGNPLNPAVLLIMGLGMQLISWPQDLVDGLVEQGYYVIRFDNRDSGLSSKFDQHKSPNLVLAYLKSLIGWKQSSAYTLDDMAEDALGLLNALGIGRAHIVGASMGGMIGQIFAARHPARTLSLTSIMSSSGRRGLPGPKASARNALMRKPPNPDNRQEMVDVWVDIPRNIGSPSFPTKKFPTTMSGAPSPLTSARSRVAWRGGLLSSVCLTNTPFDVCSSHTSDGAPG